MENYQSMIKEASRQGNIELLKILQKNNITLDLSEICIDAAIYGHLNILYWADQNGYPPNITICYYAALHGHFEILRWAHKKNVKFDNFITYLAVIFENLNIIAWLISIGHQIDDDIKKILENERIKIFLEDAPWIDRHYKCVRDSYRFIYQIIHAEVFLSDNFLRNFQNNTLLDITIICNLDQTLYKNYQGMINVNDNQSLLEIDKSIRIIRQKFEKYDIPNIWIIILTNHDAFTVNYFLKNLPNPSIISEIWAQKLLCDSNQIKYETVHFHPMFATPGVNGFPSGPSFYDFDEIDRRTEIKKYQKKNFSLTVYLDHSVARVIQIRNIGIPSYHASKPIHMFFDSS